MLQLSTYNDRIHKEYLMKILPNLKNRIKLGVRHNKTLHTLSHEAKSILLPNYNTTSEDDTTLKLLLISEPQKLIECNNEIWDKFTRLPDDSRPSKKLIEIIFNYNGVYNTNKENGYWLAKIIGRNTCVYCNRNYIFTVVDVNKAGNKGYISRPVFDHCYTKSDYPMLSLSLYNLIPSCTVCNSSVKGTKSLHYVDYIHPYVKDPEASKFTFRATKKPSVKSEWTLAIDCEKGSKIDRTLSELAIEQMYSQHASLEVTDIMNFEEAYEDGYINTIVNKLFSDSKISLSKKDVYRMLFGVEYDSDKFLDRPFSKLKRDLLKQIGLNDEFS